MTLRDPDLGECLVDTGSSFDVCQSGKALEDPPVHSIIVSERPVWTAIFSLDGLTIFRDGPDCSTESSTDTGII